MMAVKKIKDCIVSTIKPDHLWTRRTSSYNHLWTRRTSSYNHLWTNKELDWLQILYPKYLLVIKLKTKTNINKKYIKDKPETY